MSYHGHSYFSKTSEASGHHHTIEGITSFTSDKKDHRHKIRGIATDEVGVSHSYFLISSLEIPLKDGGHTHLIEGLLEDSEDNIHLISSSLNPY